MADAPRGIAERARDGVVVEISSDEEKMPVNHAPSPYKHPHEAQNGNQTPDEDPFETDDEDEDDEEFDDSDSLLNDILTAEDGNNPVARDTDVCTPQESKSYRARLREVGPDEFIKETITAGAITAKKLCTAFGIGVPMWDGRPDSGYYRILGLAIVRELETRQKLPQYNTIDDAADLLRERERILVITGAGISTNLGVPDFRSKDTGFYAKMADRFDDPQEIFDIHTFDDDPSIFFENSAETLPAPGKTSPTHAFIKLLEDKQKLLTNYTQNIDNVEGNTGIHPDKVIQCHGSWATFTCRKCGFSSPGSDYYEAVKRKAVPACPRCTETLKAEAAQRAGSKRKRGSGYPAFKPRQRGYGGGGDDDDDDDDDGRFDIPEPGVMKPDITFFGEKLPDRFFDRFIKHDRAAADLVVIIGTSMTVAPVSEIPQAVGADVPVVYISRDPVRHFNFDVVLLGDCDVVCAELCGRVGWELQHEMLPPAGQRGVELEMAEGKEWMWRVKAKERRADARGSA